MERDRSRLWATNVSRRVTLYPTTTTTKEIKRHYLQGARREGQKPTTTGNRCRLHHDLKQPARIVCRMVQRSGLRVQLHQQEGEVPEFRTIWRTTHLDFFSFLLLPPTNFHSKCQCSERGARASGLLVHLTTGVRTERKSPAVENPNWADTLCRPVPI